MGCLNTKHAVTDMHNYSKNRGLMMMLDASGCSMFGKAGACSLALGLIVLLVSTLMLFSSLPSQCYIHG